MRELVQKVSNLMKRPEAPNIDFEAKGYNDYYGCFCVEARALKILKINHISQLYAFLRIVIASSTSPILKITAYIHKPIYVFMNSTFKCEMEKIIPTHWPTRIKLIHKSDVARFANKIYRQQQLLKQI